MVGRARIARTAAGAVRDRDGRAGRQRAARQFARDAAARSRHRVRAAADHAAVPSCGRGEPRQPRRRMALRPADHRVRHAARHGPPRRPAPDHRPHDGARLRSRHHRTADVHLDGLHRVGTGRDGRRVAVRRRAGGVRVVGADSARGRVAGDALAAARKRRLARPQHRGGARGAAPRRLRLSPRRRSAGRQGTAPVRARVVDARALHFATATPVRSPLGGDAPARAARALEPAAGAVRQPDRVLGAGG